MADEQLVTLSLGCVHEHITVRRWRVSEELDRFVQAVNEGREGCVYCYGVDWDVDDRLPSGIPRWWLLDTPTRHLCALSLIDVEPIKPTGPGGHG